MKRDERQGKAFHMDNLYIHGHGEVRTRHACKDFSVLGAESVGKERR